jgi:hypothetical protein
MSASDPSAGPRSIADTPPRHSPASGTPCDVGSAAPPEAPAAAGMTTTGQRPPRDHEWSPAKKAAFLRALAATQSVSRAARAVGMGRQSAYKLKRRLAGQPFDVAWEQAVADSRLRASPAPFAVPLRCPLCGAAPGTR